MKLKNKILLFVFIALFSILLISNNSYAANTIDLKVSGTIDYTMAQEVLQLVNKERQAANLNTLEMDVELQEAAFIRAAEIGLNFDHVRANGTQWTTINYKAHGENIAMGMTTASQVMNAWMNSEGHRKAILLPDFKSIGIACFKNNNIYYWVQTFSAYDVSSKSTKTGAQYATYNVSVLNENLKIKAYKETNSTSTSYMRIENTGKYTYRIVNKENANAYSEGIASDYSFSSSNTNIISINPDGSFKAVGKGTATITIALKANPSVSFTENITVKPQEPDKVTGLKAQNNKTTTIDLIWNSQNDSSVRYEVYIYNTKQKKFKKLGDINSYGGKVYGLQSGTTQKFKVRAYRNVNEKKYYGPYSNVLTTTTATDKTKISKVKSEKKKLTVNWKKISNATGYQIQIATDKKFTKNVKNININKNKTVSTTIKNLKSKKKYFIRVRTFRKVAGKKIYSGWTAVKNVKTK